MKFFLFLLVLYSSFLLQESSEALPLSTDSRWIVDEGGRRVKLACVNWASHLETMLAEGLSKQPVDAVSKRIAAMGFNCVRLTWPLYMVTNDSLASLTVRQSFQNIGLNESLAGIRANNPSMVDLPLIQAFQVVVSTLGGNEIMVILDNHISKPGWCCSNFDGNGFFGDKYFDPDVWVKGLTQIASMFNGSSHVIGMSLRNELRGPKQNLTDWYRYMQKGAEAVHSTNPNVLVILSGLNFDNDLNFLSEKQVDLTFTGKLVFEFHWYAFSDGQAWVTGNPNQVCGAIIKNVMRRVGFLLDQRWPLFLSEFGVDQRGVNENDNRYLNCLSGVLAELDLDWALWALQGSYYLREGTIGLDETYGVLNWSWCGTRNSSFVEKISVLQTPFQGPGLAEVNLRKLIFHPHTGLCVLRQLLLDELKLGPCANSEGWGYSIQNILTIKGTYFCLQADDFGKPAKLGLLCMDSRSKWDMISDSKMHLSSKLSNGSAVCLDVDANDTIITNPCTCLSKDKTCDPSSQWFKLVNSTRSRTSSSILSLPASVGTENEGRGSL